MKRLIPMLRWLTLAALLLLLSGGSFAVTRNVKGSCANNGDGTTSACAGSPGGVGAYNTIQACATAMAAGDTCTVFAGTYNESPSIPAGTVGNYKTLTVNGSDVVTVKGFTVNSHTKLIGNCTAPAAAGSCGFTITTPSAPKSGACVGWTSSITDFYIVNNVMTQCGASGGYMVGSSFTILSDHGFIRGNTLSYACVNSASINHGECNSIMPFGDHFLVENNDLSHYTLSIDFGTNLSVYRNNTFHDQFETEASGNFHTDAFFSEPGAGVAYTVKFNVIEGNFQYNGVGANAKTDLFQNDSGTTCPNCFNAIFRFNTISRIGSGAASNYFWPHIMAYNNTLVDLLADGTANNGTADFAQQSSNGSYLNQLYYFSFASGVNFNVYQCGTGCNFGHNLYWCTGTCSQVWGNVAAVPFLSDPGNKNANPLFVNYVSPGSLANDYHLQVGSPAIGAGTFLTTVNGTVSGSTSLVVTDASYFQDGYGLSNAYSTVNADCIAVTTALNHVCVTAVNYSTNTLTLASPISATNGDAVWLWKDSSGNVQLTGVNPNIGAFQTTTPVPIATFTPSSVNFGNVPVGLTSNPIPVTLRNTGAANLVVSTVSLGSAVFSLINNTCGSPATITNTIPGTGFTLTPGASCTFQAIYQPVVPNFTNTASVFFSPGASNPDALSLTGNSTGPAAPSTIMFAGKVATNTLCKAIPAITQLCFAVDCGCWWISANGAAYTPFGVSSLNGKTGAVVLGIQ